MASRRQPAVVAFRSIFQGVPLAGKRLRGAGGNHILRWPLIAIHAKIVLDVGGWRWKLTGTMGRLSRTGIVRCVSILRAVDEGMPLIVIVGAIMTKLLHIICGVLRDGQPFNPNHHKNAGIPPLVSRPSLTPSATARRFLIRQKIHGIPRSLHRCGHLLHDPHAAFANPDGMHGCRALGALDRNEDVRIAGVVGYTDVDASF